jgi:ribonuclease BN (tRNA processing enzyme)
MDLGKAVEFKHSTALEAALFASSIKAKILFLYHISSRYKDRGLLEREARRVHPHTYAASKYMALTV